MCSTYFFIHSTLKAPLSELEPNSGDLSLPMGEVICAYPETKEEHEPGQNGKNFIFG